MRVICLYSGGTGNLPVPLGYQPSGMEGDVHLQPRVCFSNERPARSGLLPADRHRQVACATHSNLDLTVMNPYLTILRLRHYFPFGGSVPVVNSMFDVRHSRNFVYA